MQNELRHLDHDEILQSTREIEVLGYTKVENVLSEQLLENLLSIIEKNKTLGAGAKPESAGVSKNQANDMYVYHLQYVDKIFLDVLTEWKGGLDILQHFLNDPYYRQIPENEPNFLLGFYNARSSVDFLPLHIDNYVPSLGNHPNAMQIIFSLNGQTEAKGGTFVVPGSHRSGLLPDRSLNNITTPINCNPGDALIWDSRLWHGAGENKTNEDRWSLVATFRPWYLKQNFDPVRGMTSHMFNKLSDSQKALLGFLSIPPRDEYEKIVLKEGYDSLLPSIQEYRDKPAND